jgi:hypothetical protein
MRRGWVLVGGLALALASACGSDESKPPPGETNDAGGGGEGATTQAGMPGTPAGAGGTPDVPMGGTASGLGGGGQGGASNGALGGGGQSGGVEGGEGGEGGVVSKDIDGRIYGLSDDLVILVDGVNVPVDSNGHFTVPDAPDEYQLIVCAPNNAYVQIWDGLHTRTPLVDIGTGFDDPPYGATIRGKVSGGLSAPFSVADDESVFTELAYSSNRNGYLYPLSSIDPPEGYELNPSWPGSATDEGELLAIQYVFKSKVGVKQYTGFGRRPITIGDGNIYGSLDGSAGTNVELSAPTASPLTGHFGLPSGWTRKSSFIHMGPFSTDLVFEGDFSLVMPQLANVPMWVLIQADGPDGRVDFKAPVPSTGPWNIDVPSPPKALLPVAGANAVTPSTIFSWNGLPADAIASVFWEVGDWRIQRYTNAATTTLPDLSVFGATLPPATEGVWVIGAAGPATTTDEVLNMNHTHNLDVPEASYFMDGADRLFTTAP